MNIYHYNPGTGELIATDTAREDPLLPGQYRLPAFATIDTPPGFIEPGKAAAYLNAEGQVPHDYRDGAWRELSDFRGSYFRIDNGQPETLARMAVSPQEAGLTDQEPPAFAKWNGRAWEVDQVAQKANQARRIAAAIATIEQQEQPAAQREFSLTGDKSALQAVQDKIDALQAQIQE